MVIFREPKNFAAARENGYSRAANRFPPAVLSPQEYKTLISFDNRFAPWPGRIPALGPILKGPSTLHGGEASRYAASQGYGASSETGSEIS